MIIECLSLVKQTADAWRSRSIVDSQKEYEIVVRGSEPSITGCPSNENSCSEELGMSVESVWALVIVSCVPSSYVSRQPRSCGAATFATWGTFHTEKYCQDVTKSGVLKFQWEGEAA